ncbi:MAG: hypothetical protein GY711_04635 [bacterium]|nr:hypothetical protein [bacterium]
MRAPIALLTLTTLTTLTTLAPAQERPTQEHEVEWRYVVPPADAPQRHALPTALALGTEKPEELIEKVEFRGDFQRFGRLRYGDADSLRVFVVLDHVSDTEIDLYVDTGRDFMIQEDDLVPFQGGRWETSVAVETVLEGGLTEHVPRRVMFTLGKTGSIFSYATLGYLEGSVPFGVGELRVRRIDGNGNGFFTDSRDQLWLDLDSDGEWAPFRELFLYAPILTIAGERFALRSDRLGAELAIEKVDGLGKIELALEGAGEERRVTSMNVLLVGSDGSAALVRAQGESLEVPVGRYRIGMVTLRLADPGGGRDWSYVFSEPGGDRELVWHDLERDATCTIDPIGELRFEVGLKPAAKTCKAGELLSGSPGLYTQDGLLINTAYRGRTAPSFYSDLSANVILLGPDGARLDVTDSGFA